MASNHEADRPAEAPPATSAPPTTPPTPPSPISPTASRTQGEQAAEGLPPQTPSRPAAAHQSMATPLPAPYNRHQHPVQAFPAQALSVGAGNPLLSPRGSRAWAYSRFALNLGAFVAALVVFSITCSFLTNSVQDIMSIALINLPVAVVAMAWTLAEMITFSVRNGGIKLGRDFKDGIHPGASVGMNLILWMAWTLPIAITTISGNDLEDMYNRCQRKSQGTGYYGSSWYNYCDRGSAAIIAANGDRVINSDIPRFRALVVFCIAALVLQFAIFVGACVDTEKRNKAKRIIYVQAPMPMMMVPPYGGWPQQPPQSTPGMMYPMAAMHFQSPQGVPHPGPYPNQGQQQPRQGEKPASNPSPMMTGYYAPAPPADVAQRPQPTQSQIPLDGYYAPSGPTSPR